MPKRNRSKRPGKLRRTYTIGPAKRRRLLTKFHRIFRRVIIVLLLVGILGGSYYLVFESSTFLIKDINISGAVEFVSHADVHHFLLTNYENKNLIFTDTGELESRLEDLFLGASNIEVKKVWPEGLQVLVTERVPLALLHNEKTPSKFMVDREGYVLGLVDESRKDLPAVYYSEDLRVGTFVNRELIPVYQELIAALEDSEVKASSMSFYPRHVVFYTREGIKVLVDNEKDKFHALEVISRLLHQLTLQGKDASTIDLRYDKVVVY